MSSRVKFLRLLKILTRQIVKLVLHLVESFKNIYFCNFSSITQIFETRKQKSQDNSACYDLKRKLSHNLKNSAKATERWSLLSMLQTTLSLKYILILDVLVISILVTKLVLLKRLLSASFCTTSMLQPCSQTGRDGFFYLRVFKLELVGK